MLSQQTPQPLSSKSDLNIDISTKKTATLDRKSEDDGDFENHECDFNFCCICICFANICAPFYSTCTFAFHIVTSIPGSSFVALAFAISGIAMFRHYFVLLEEVLDNAGLNGDYYLKPLDALGGFLIVLDSLIMVCSALLTGWTRHAFCNCLRSGVYEYKGDKKIGFPCWSCFFRVCGCSLLVLLLFSSYVGWLLAATAVVITSIAWFMCFLAINACHLGQDAVEQLFSILTERLSFADIGTVEYDNYCDSSKYQIRDSTKYMIIGTLLLLVGQVNFFCIMTDNLRVARLERKKEAERLNGGKRMSNSVLGWGSPENQYL